MTNLLFSNRDDFEEKLKAIKKAGQDKLHILADFDKTLTYPTTIDGKPLPSVISILRDFNYLSEEYSESAKALFERYHLIEKDTSIPIEERRKAMNEWWTTHFELLIRSGLNKSHLERIVDEGIIRLREGTRELFGYLHKRNIPLVILSSSGVGNTIPMILQREGILYDNVYVVTNLFDFDEEGRATKVSEPIIHSMGKSETSLEDHPAYDAIKDRPNVVLLGDSLSDIEMTGDRQTDTVLKIALLNEADEETVKRYREAYDVLLTDDLDINFVKDLLTQIR